MAEINTSVENGYFACNKCLIPLHDVIYVDYQQHSSFFYLPSGKYYHVSSTITDDDKIDIANYIRKRGPIKSPFYGKERIIESEVLSDTTIPMLEQINEDE